MTDSTDTTILRIPGKRARDNGLPLPRQAHPEDGGLDLFLDLTPVKVEDIDQQPWLARRVGDSQHAIAMHYTANARDANFHWQRSPIVKRQRGQAYVHMQGVTREDWLRILSQDGELAPSEVRRLRLVLEPDAIVWVRTGWMLDLPSFTVGHIKGRSGLAFKRGVTTWHIGTDDARFQGELLVGLWNAGEKPQELQHSDRVAQLVVAGTLSPMEVHEVEAFEPSPRGANGFGSTGR